MRFLIPTTSEPTEPMTSWLAAVAGKTDVQVRLLAVGDDARAPEPGMLRSFLQPEVMTRRGDAAAGVIAEAAAYQPAFIALATRGLRGMVASMRGSLAASLIADATVPLALFGPECRPTTTMKRLILPLDGSAYAARSLPAIAAMARELGLHITLLEVMDEAAPSAAPGDPGSARDIMESSYITHVAHELNGLEVDWDVGHGDPVLAITDIAASRSGSVIVMTSHGHAGLRRKLVGSVTETVVARATVPVVVIPPHWRPG
jgi:nucleotide-binding universal stress UspA family protein